MKTPGSLATPADVTPTPPYKFRIAQLPKIPKMETAPSKLLKIKKVEGNLPISS
jgi:hypothetical protein